MKLLSDSISACDYTLSLDPTSTKAFFRRAKARTDSINASENDYELAISDFE